MSEIIADIKSILSLPLVPRQRKYYEDLIAVAKPVKISRAHDVIDSYMLDFIKHVVKPEKKKMLQECASFVRGISGHGNIL